PARHRLALARAAAAMSYLTDFWTSNSPDPGCIVFTDKSYGDHGYLEAGGWCVPIMWSVCFSSADVNVLLKPENEWSDPDQPAYGASCDTTTESAARRVEQRLP